MPLKTPRATEDRLDSLRAEARLTGRVAGNGLPIAGGPIPRAAASLPGYYGQPIVKPPVWTWQIGLYLFVGGTAGMSGVIAFASLLSGQPHALVRAALGVALAGALLSPVLLIWDLGRPARFLNMFRVFKWRSAMSMGVWTLTVFGGFAGSAFVLVQAWDFLTQSGVSPSALRGIALALVAGTALSGAILATYTGVLLGATAVPVWSARHKLLPFHFGSVGLGSAAAVLELLGFRLAALNAIGLTVATVETGVGVWIEMGRQGATARAIHRGTPGRLLRIAALLTGPIPLILRVVGWSPIAAVGFLIGALTSRYGWISAGRVSATDPEEVIETQQRSTTLVTNH
ncbi:MAG: polysulfide reductase NrfD [Acidobacteria bacterium]|nr:polysulfide reductase NrfD [Acidobacteriota bacterium]